MTLLLDEKTVSSRRLLRAPDNSATCGMPGLELLDWRSRVCHFPIAQTPLCARVTKSRYHTSRGGQHFHLVTLLMQPSQDFTHQIRRFSRFQAARPGGLASIEALFWVRLRHWAFLTG